MQEVKIKKVANGYILKNTRYLEGEERVYLNFQDLVFKLAEMFEKGPIKIVKEAE